jgi:uncharacterized membrane protein
VSRREGAGDEGAGDEGSISLLSLGFAVLAIVLILVVAAATQLQLDRTRLCRMADELAIDAADAMDVPAYYAGNAERPTDLAAVDLSPASMRAVVNGHLTEYAERYHLDDVAIVGVSSPDGKTAVVSVALVVRPLFGLDALLPWSDGITLSTTSSARAR